MIVGSTSNTEERKELFISTSYLAQFDGYGDYEQDRSHIVKERRSDAGEHTEEDRQMP